MTASGASLGPLGDPQKFVGKIVGLEGTQVALSLRNGAQTLGAIIDLRIAPDSHTVTGSVRVVPSTAESD